MDEGEYPVGQCGEEVATDHVPVYVYGNGNDNDDDNDDDDDDGNDNDNCRRQRLRKESLGALSANKE